jgi:hypothetical protein
MQQQVLDYGRPSQGEAFARAARPVLRAAVFLFRTGSRGGAIAQVCIWFVWISVPRSPANVAQVFWRREALAATLFSLLWLLCVGRGERLQPALFLIANGLGCAIIHLLPILN